MKKTIALLVLISACAVAQSRAVPYDPCTEDLKEESTLAQSCNLYRELRRLEPELDATYATTLKQMLDPAFLVKAQQSWLTFREDSCNLDEHEFGGLNSVSYLRCRYAMTKERILYLKTHF